MPTYISMLNWSGMPQPSITDMSREIELQSPSLRRRGVHSVVFLPDEGACAAIMVATCEDACAVERVARAIAPAASMQIESMLFDDDPGTPAWLQNHSVPPLPRGAARELLEAIAADA